MALKNIIPLGETNGEPRYRMAFEFRSEKELCEKLARFLQDHDWICVEAPPLYTPKELAARYDLPPSTLSKRLHHFPGSYPGQTGPTGRIIQIHVTAELDLWLKAAGRRSLFCRGPLGRKPGKEITR